MGNFTDKDKGWNKMMSNFKVNAGETAGFVGYLRSSGDYKNQEHREAEAKSKGGDVKPPAPITMAQLASVHEFGTADGRIPERSFMRSSLDEHSKDLKRLTSRVVDQIVMGKMDKKRGLGVICEKMKGWFINRIVDGPFKPLKASTIARKGSDKPLIDTGQLKNSIDWEIKAGKK